MTKNNSVHTDDDTHNKLKALSKIRKANNDMCWSHQNIVKDLINKEFKKVKRYESK